MNRLRTGEWITIACLALAGIVWAVRLEGRVNLQDRELAAIEATAKDNDKRLVDDVAYIRRRLDEVIDRGLR